MLDAIASRVVVLWGWRRLLLAFAAGAASALAMAPFDAFPVLFVTFTVLVWLVDGTSGRRRLRAAAAAALIGWCFGFGYFLAGLWWVGSAFLVDAEVFGWMLPFAVAALPAGLALFPALGLFIARLVWTSGPRRIVAFAIGIAVTEFARGHVLTGFPWNTFGYALTVTPAMMQAASVVGVYGLTALAALIFASPAALSGNGSRRARIALPVLGLTLLAVIAGYGTLRLATAGDGTVETLRLRIVQPAIPQIEKWKPENRSRIFAEYLTLSDTAASPEVTGVSAVDLLIWPESALPFVFDTEPAALPAIAALLPPGTTLLTGMQRLVRDPEAPDGYRVFNSVMVIDEAGAITDVYDKSWLVPFGEFLPFQPVLEAMGLQQLTQVAGGFSAGQGPRTLPAPGAPAVLPLVCYEIIFPGAFDGLEQRPGWILNVTNDAWFGDSPGPWQHLRQARVRAVEEGLPLVRAANTGISAVVDPYGRIVRRLGLNVRGVIDSPLPVALDRTVYTLYGNWLFWGLVTLMLLGCARLKPD